LSINNPENLIPYQPAEKLDSYFSGVADTDAFIAGIGFMALAANTHADFPDKLYEAQHLAEFMNQ
jgi:hypothetical protein